MLCKFGSLNSATDGIGEVSCGARSSEIAGQELSFGNDTQQGSLDLVRVVCQFQVPEHHDAAQ